MTLANSSGAPSVQAHPDLFLCDNQTWALKDDLASMDVPIYSLSRYGDTKVRKYTRGNKSVTIIPSTLGAATVFDKDLLLFVASQIIDARNKGVPVSRKVRVESYDYLIATRRGDGRNSFESVLGTLRRLKGTNLETNIETNGIQQTEGFGLIEDYRIISEKKRTIKKTDEHSGKQSIDEVSRVLSFELTLSEWMMNGLLNWEVLTIDDGYFGLDKPIDRRLYEIARRHCGDKALWKINIDLLSEKLGTTRERFKIRADLRETIKSQPLPEYRIALDTSKKLDDVVFYTRSQSQLAKYLIDNNLIKWFESLEREST